ncbi:MAG: hypothetical protein AB9861_05180 [Methanosarcina sp.]|jgi:hypothetical protein
MSKPKIVILSFIISELFILIIELTFGVPLNVYYYLDPTLINTTDAMFPFLPAAGGLAESTGDLISITNFVSIFLWLMSSPALLIAVVVCLLAPDDESKSGPDSYI